VVPPEEIKQIVDDYIKQHLDSLSTNEWAGIGRTVANVRSAPGLRWANPLDVKAAVEAAYLAAFGPKQDLATLKAKAKASQ
jgi:glutaminyl-tRNA synthetase